MIPTKEDAILIGAELVFTLMVALVVSLWFGLKGALSVGILYLGGFVLANAYNWWSMQ